jgi:hypothetical protein
MNGELDPIAQPAHGKSITAVVKNAEFIAVPDWGHGIEYPKLWPNLIEHLKNFIRGCSRKILGATL